MHVQRSTDQQGDTARYAAPRQQGGLRPAPFHRTGGHPSLASRGLASHGWAATCAITAVAVMGLIAAAPSDAIAAAASPASQDWAAVDAQTQNIAGALGRTAAPIDRRIKLARCPEALAITAMDSNSLAVRCASLGWRLRVAMRSNAAQDSQDSAQSNFFAPNSSAAKRTPAAPPMIRRGDVVRISIDTPNYSVSYPATATQEGRLGETITLRGADPKNPILAVVTGPGRAEINR